MSTYTQLYYHIVFGTKHRTSCLVEEHRETLFKYIWGLLKKKKCQLYQINGMEDHIHIFTDIHPTISLSSLVKDIKLASHSIIKEENLFPKFEGWQKGYGAFTHDNNDKDRIVKYIANQQNHHKKISWREEYISLLKKHGIEFDEKYLL